MQISRRIFLVVLGASVLGIMVVCTILVWVFLRTPPPRLPQLHERYVAGPDLYSGLRWSPDGRYLAYATSTNFVLTIYDLSTKQGWSLGKRAIYFEWTPSNNLAYLSYRSDLSGNPYPEIYELHTVNLDGTQDRLLADKLYNPSNFQWFRDGHRLLILMADANGQSDEQDVYLLDLDAGMREKLISRQDLAMQDITTIVLSADEMELLVDGRRGEPTPTSNVPFFILYDLHNHRISQEINWHNVFPPTTYGPHIRSNFGSDLNFVQTANTRWVIGSINAPEGECYNYAVYFLNVTDQSKNFCIPSVKGIISEVVVSPDLSQIAYLNIVGPGVYYVMVANLNDEYRIRLEK